MWRTLFQKKPPEDNERHRTGLWGEKLAARMLKEKGYKVLGQRVRLSRRDELDLVVRNQDTLVFVEVKTRKSEDFGRPASTINRGKRHALSRAAMRYMKRVKQRPDFIRFDVVEVVGSEGDKNPTVRHTENAFSLDAAYRAQW